MNLKRFVVLWHEMPIGSERPSHFDLMFEHGDELRAWAIPTQPAAGMTISAMALPNHRKHYLQFEGEVSGGRGTVQRWDSGTYELIEDTDNRFVVHVAGKTLSATFSFAQEADTWTLQIT